uniref:Uncharacterized protein n=1 Tax=Trichogramma kaykai TaxID=54128 RepID=A0ABD2X232_9HYME
MQIFPRPRYRVQRCARKKCLRKQQTVMVSLRIVAPRAIRQPELCAATVAYGNTHFSDDERRYIRLATTARVSAKN